MHTISYKFTTDYNENLPNNNYSEETTELTFEGNDYDFIDYLNDHHVYFIKDGNEYIVLDEDDDETGERYLVVSDTIKTQEDE